VVDKLAEIVTPGDFEDPQRAEVWASIVELADGRNGISAVTVASHIMSRRTGALRRGLLETDQDVLEFVLAAGDNVLTAVGSEWHAAMVAGAAKLRRFQTEATKVAAASAGADPAEAMRFIEASLDRMSAPFEATRQQADISGKSVLKALSERVQLVCRGQQGPRGPTTQLADLDNIVAEMQPGKTWILGGNSGHGKTAFTCLGAGRASRTRAP
jgi:replicative DNA helicase